MNIIFRIFCVYDEPSADLCLHKDLHLSNVHHLAVKRDGVQSIQIEQESACSIIYREETAGMSHIIFHIDVNSAYLSWTAVEQLKNGADVDIRTIPAIIGGDRESRHGIVLAKSPSAKKFGIRTGEPVVNAFRKCPNLHMDPPNHRMYREYSRRLMDFLKTYTPEIEQVSVDECYMDFTGIAQRFSSPVEAAYEIKARVYEKFGFTVNVGISTNKLLAKMASDFTKPDHVHTLWKSEMSEKMWHLPVGDLFYVGHASLYKLKILGFHTIGELAAMDPAILRAHMKSQGILIWQYANGIDESAVISSPPPAKGYGNSLTTPYDVMDCETARQYLLSLSETISARLRADGVKISVVSISLKDWDLRFYGHQITLSVPTDLTLEIYAAACRCLSELWNGIPLRHLGIHTSRVSSDPFRQMQFFETIDYEKYRKMEKTVDQIRKRFGMDSIKRACFLPSAGSVEIDHMGGGVSREKRTVDYSQEKIL